MTEVERDKSTPRKPRSLEDLLEVIQRRTGELPTLSPLAWGDGFVATLVLGDRAYAVPADTELEALDKLLELVCT